MESSTKTTKITPRLIKYFTSSRLRIPFVIFLIFTDQISKYWASESGFVSINHGISFGWSFLSTQAFLMISIFLIILVFLFLVKEKMLVQQALVWQLFFAGAISNLLDRLFLGGVRDWLLIPVFGLKNNLADCFINLGVLFILLKVVKLDHNKYK